MWNAVCWGIIIPSGWRHTRDTTLYRHLWRSVNGVRRRRRGSGADWLPPVSSACTAKPMPGWQRNIVHTFLASAPS